MHWGINPSLKSTNCPSPPLFLGNPPAYILVFREAPLLLKIWLEVQLPSRKAGAHYDSAERSFSVKLAIWKKGEMVCTFAGMAVTYVEFKTLWLHNFVKIIDQNFVLGCSSTKLTKICKKQCWNFSLNSHLKNKQKWNPNNAIFKKSIIRTEKV